jgi:D-alanyl-D-alanine carboxypeptidase
MLRRILLGLLLLVGAGIGGFIAVVFLAPHGRTTAAPPAVTATPVASGAPAGPIEQVRAPGDTLSVEPPLNVAKGGPAVPSLTPAPPIAVVADCSAHGFEPAAAANAASLRTLAWKPFHRPEIGWEAYAPRIDQEIGTTCAPDTNGFAMALSHWQKIHRLPPNGRLDVATFTVMNASWELQRPFVRISATGVCPEPPAGAGLTKMAAGEAYGGKSIQLRTEALDAYRHMVAAARAESPAINADHHLLTVLSGYRSPEDDNARCAKDNDCGNITRALCSAHRTGLAVDLYLGGPSPASTDDANRLRQSKTLAYAWLMANASRFGFLNYPFEPWHWEWTGAAQ